MYANNNIHSMFTKPYELLDEEEKNNLGAMNARMKRHQFRVSYKGTLNFPYSSSQIAQVLDYLDKTLKEEDYSTSIPVRQEEVGPLNAIDMPIFKVSEQ